MARLPVPGSDSGNWGSILNDYLMQTHASDGSLHPATVGTPQLQDSAVTVAKLDSTNVPGSNQILSFNGTSLTWVTNTPSGTVPDADATTKGLIQLNGDLGGTASSPTVPGLGTKENAITTGTISQYWRGDKSWQTLDKTALGLGNVDNTSDINKPVSTATQTALNSKANDTITFSAGTGLSGGGDLSSNRSFGVVSDTTVQRIRISDSGSLVGIRQELNLIEGSNVTLTAVDNSINNRVDVTIAATNNTSVNADSIIIVAANDAETILKDNADYLCDGLNDEVQINAALATYGSVTLSPGTFNISGTIALPQAAVLRGSGTKKTNLVAAAGITNSFITITTDHCTISDLSLTGNGIGTIHGIDANITSSTGFLTGADACVTLYDLVMSNITGDGVRMSGSFNRDSKLRGIQVWNAVGRSFYIDCPDGSMLQCVSGTPGSHGVELDSGSSNWRVVNCKSWYADGDGFWIKGARHTLSACESQDNMLAGFRVTGNILQLEACTADSNSWDPSSGVGSGGALANTHSGFEIGRLSDGSNSGGFDITMSGCQSWDKNETSRGYAQRSGIRIRSGARRLSLSGFNTGDPSATHHNVTAGIEFDTSSDQTNSTNAIIGVSHGVSMLSAGLAPPPSYRSYRTSDHAAVTSTSLTNDDILTITLPGTGRHYRFECLVRYVADATDNAVFDIFPQIVAGGSGTPLVESMVTYAAAGAADPDILTYKSCFSNGSTHESVTVDGKGNVASYSNQADVREVLFKGTMYIPNLATNGVTETLRVAAGGTVGSTGVRILTRSYIWAEELV